MSRWSGLCSRSSDGWPSSGGGTPAGGTTDYTTTAEPKTERTTTAEPKIDRPTTSGHWLAERPVTDATLPPDVAGGMGRLVGAESVGTLGEFVAAALAEPA